MTYTHFSDFNQLRKERGYTLRDRYTIPFPPQLHSKVNGWRARLGLPHKPVIWWDEFRIMELENAAGRTFEVIARFSPSNPDLCRLYMSAGRGADAIFTVLEQINAKQ